MNRIHNSDQQATVEHLVDKWSSPKHIKSYEDSNLVAACYQCNNSRGNIRNKIARSYYKRKVGEKGIKLKQPVSSTPSKELYKLFGPVPQNLFNI
jgi:5-methylcytosine-specific restriction endonuclease McrA